MKSGQESNPFLRQVIGTDLSVTPFSARYHYGT